MKILESLREVGGRCACVCVFVCVSVLRGGGRWRCRGLGGCGCDGLDVGTFLFHLFAYLFIYSDFLFFGYYCVLFIYFSMKIKRLFFVCFHALNG